MSCLGESSGHALDGRSNGNGSYVVATVVVRLKPCKRRQKASIFSIGIGEFKNDSSLYDLR